MYGKTRIFPLIRYCIIIMGRCKRNWRCDMKSPIKTEPLVGLLRHFVGRETATFSTVRKSKAVSVSLNLFQKCISLQNVNITYRLLEFQTVEKVVVSLPTQCLSNPTSGSA